MFGYDASEVIGRHLAVLMPATFPDRVDRPFDRDVLDRRPGLVGKTIELAGRRKDGTEFPLELSLSLVERRGGVLFIGSVSAMLLAAPAFLFMMHGAIWSTLLGLALLAIPVTFYVSNLASSLPALFPTSSRYGGMGISYNFAVAIFGGFAPFIMQALVTLSGSSLAPAFWVMGTSVAGFIAVCFLKESARKPLPGSMPSVATDAEAVELVKTQDENPDIDVAALFPEAPTNH
jgi:MHS family proline/betaine transporter-like MFS transporter